MLKKGKWTVPGQFRFLFLVQPVLNATYFTYTGYKEKFGDLNLM